MKKRLLRLSFSLTCNLKETLPNTSLRKCYFVQQRKPASSFMICLKYHMEIQGGGIMTTFPS